MTQTYFLHIPKTAGTSFVAILNRHFSSDEISPYSLLDRVAELIDKGEKEELNKYPLIQGHLGYSVIKYLGEAPQIITMLRDPIERTISLFNHIKREESHWMHKDISPEATIEEFLSYPPARNLVCNFQICNIAMDFDLSKEFKNKNGDILGKNQGSLLAEAVDIEDKQDEKLLDIAKDRLEKFTFVGITEEFEKSIKLLEKIMGWEVAGNIPTENVSPKTSMSKENLSKETLEDIRSLTKLDQEIYEFAKDIFEKRFEKEFKN